MKHPALSVPIRAVFAEETLKFRKQSARQRSQSGLGVKDWLVVRAGAKEANTDDHAIRPLTSELPSVLSRLLSERSSRLLIAAEQCYNGSDEIIECVGQVGRRDRRCRFPDRNSAISPPGTSEIVAELHEQVESEM